MVESNFVLLFPLLHTFIPLVYVHLITS